MNDNQPIIAVVAAIIYHDNKIFAAQRKELGVRFNKWEFPGGKIEKQETAIAALYRELEEELNIRVHNPRLFTHIQHDYEVFMLEMDVFFVDLLPNETIVYQAHKTGGWFSLAEIQKLDLLPADRKVVDQLLKSVGKRSDDGKS